MSDNALSRQGEGVMASATRPSAAGTGGKLWIVVGLFVAVILLALLVAIIGTVVWLALSATTTSIPDPDRKWPRLANIAIVSVPLVALFLGTLLARNIGGATFYQEQATNRRISLLFLLALVGLLTALGEIIVASLTFDADGALIGAGIAALFGLGAAVFAHRRGVDLVLSSARAQPADPFKDAQLHNVVDEISIAANMPRPRVYVIPDDSANAMAVGTRADNAAVAVTRGMLNRFDREELQGVIGHELAHIRNLDSRYGVYVAILVGMVALVTDGFLRLVLEAWRNGLFFKGAEAADDDWKGALAGLAAGLGFGLFLLLIAGLLKLFAPIAALLVQAAVSRQREYLADATSVELTRNPVGLARALNKLKFEDRPLVIANRGSQHLWFNSPIGGDDDTGWHLLATHPTLDARIQRLAELNVAGVENAVADAVPTAAPAPAGPEG
jgi:heat shock protein HtpX